jgi:hypothetical protein
VTQSTAVSLHQFVDFGTQLRIGFVVDADHLDLAPEKPALSIDVILPDLMCQTGGLAVRSKRAAQRQTISNANGLFAHLSAAACMLG